MDVRFLDLTRVIRTIRPQLDGWLAAAIETGQFVGGDPVEQFEQSFAAFCGAHHCIGVGSGTDAMTLSLRALGVGTGDEVITAANTCVPTVVGIKASGATPVPVDVEPETFTLDPSLSIARPSPSWPRRQRGARSGSAEFAAVPRRPAGRGG